MTPSGIATVDDVTRQVASAFERDRYLAALLAPAVARADLIVLAAFAGELGRIPAMVNEPMAGHLRLQWWRDTVARRMPSGHPVADALVRVIDRHSLPPADIEAIITSVEADLEPEPFADESEFAAHHAVRQGAIFGLAGHCLGVALPEATLELAGRAWGITRTLVELPALLADGRNPLPRSLVTLSDVAGDRIASAAGSGAARRAIVVAAKAARRDLVRLRTALSGPIRPASTALLPLALVEPYLRSVENRYDPSARVCVDITPLRRVWGLWRAHRTGRLGW